MKLSKIMERARLVRGTSYMTLYVNLSGIGDESDINDIYRYALSFVSKLPDRSLTLLINLTGLGNTQEIREKLDEMIFKCSKYFVRTALVADNVMGDYFKGITHKYGVSNVMSYKDADAAKNYIMTYRAYDKYQKSALSKRSL